MNRHGWGRGRAAVSLPLVEPTTRFTNKRSAARATMQSPAAAAIEPEPSSPSLVVRMVAGDVTSPRRRHRCKRAPASQLQPSQASPCCQAQDCSRVPGQGASWSRTRVLKYQLTHWFRLDNGLMLRQGPPDDRMTICPSLPVALIGERAAVTNMRSGSWTVLTIPAASLRIWKDLVSTAQPALSGLQVQRRNGE
ncbi:hypothetical protein G7046_g4918 [Stylonectria norvegica]|nr:hypothetical protein G7046_g4918 [Stylonectria norvegica]